MPSTPNLADTIYDDLVRRIFQGELLPGDKLPAERQLAADYDTNRNTLREALRRLEHARLVAVRQGSGVTVTDWRKAGRLDSLGLLIKHTQVPTERVRVLVDLLWGRMAVLEHAVALAAQRRTDDQLERIDRILEGQLVAFNDRDKRALMRGDMALVEALVDAANSVTARWIANSFLEVYQQLVDAAASLWVFQPEFPDFLATLKEALHSGDAEGATAATRAYYAASDATVLKVLKTLIPGSSHSNAPHAPQETDHGHRQSQDG